MPEITRAAETLAYLFDRDDVVDNLDQSNKTEPLRALLVNERTLIVPHESQPDRLYSRELDLIVGPREARDPFSRARVTTVGVVEFWANAYLAWIRFAPAVPVEAPLPEEPWDRDGPLVQALQELPQALREGGERGFWEKAAELRLTEDPAIEDDFRFGWHDRARSGLEVTERPKLVSVSAEGDYKWRLWPPELW
jgi:hypothetical protein